MRQANGSICVLLAAVVLCLWHIHADAAIYQCVDRTGAVSFTNVPSAQNCRVLEEEARPSLPVLSQGFRFSEHFSVDSNAYDQHIKIVSLRYGVDPHLIKAMIRTESDFDCNAISRHGAQGLMQLMPGTARDLNVVNPFDPGENIDGGVRYFRMILDSFDGNLPLSLAAYNAGPNLVKRSQRIPAIPETVDYVKRVLSYYKGYKGGKIERISMPSVIRVRELVTEN
jgi:hypothetical protein